MLYDFKVKFAIKVYRRWSSEWFSFQNAHRHNYLFHLHGCIFYHLSMIMTLCLIRNYLVDGSCFLWFLSYDIFVCCLIEFFYSGHVWYFFYWEFYLFLLLFCHLCHCIWYNCTNFILSRRTLSLECRKLHL